MRLQTAHAQRNPCEYSEYPCEYSEYPARSHSIGHSSRGTHCTQQLHRIHALQSSARLQLEQAAAAGTEKALLARVTAQNPDASFIELLRLFKARCRMGPRSARCTCACCHRVCGAVASAAIDRRSHSRPLSPGRFVRWKCVFVRRSVRFLPRRSSAMACLFVSLFVCVRRALANHPVDGAACAATRGVAR